jgi:hypothetical protein
VQHPSSLFKNLRPLFENELQRNQAVLAIYSVEKRDLNYEPYGPLGYKLNFFLHHLIVLADGNEDGEFAIPFIHPTRLGVQIANLPTIPELNTELVELAEM